MNDNFYREIGERIRELRKERGMVQEDYEELLGYTQSKASRLENGIGVHDLHLLRDISVAFNASLEYLIFGVALKENRFMANEKKKSVVSLGRSAEDDKTLREVLGRVPEISVRDRDGRPLLVSCIDDSGEEIRPYDNEELDTMLLNLREDGCSTSFSFLSSVKDSPDSWAAAENMAEIILANADGRDESPYWRAAEKSLLAFALAYMAKTGDKDCNILRVLYAFTEDGYSPSFAEDLLEESQELYAIYNALIKDRNIEMVAHAVRKDLEGHNFVW